MARLRFNTRCAATRWFVWCFIAIGTLLFAVSTAGVADAFQSENITSDITSDFRSWTNDTGKFTIEAKLLKLEDDRVKLEKKDGRVIDLPLNKLSDKDKTFIETLRKKAQDFSGEESNPFAGGSASTPNARNKKPATASTTSRSKKLTFRSKNKGTDSKTISVATVFPDTALVDEGWKVEIDAADLSQPKKLFRKVITLPPVSEGKSFHDRRAIPKVDRTGTIAAVSASNPFDKQTGLGVIELATGDSLGASLIPIKDAKIFAVDSDNQQILTYEKGSVGAKDKIAFRSFDDLENPTKVWELAKFSQRDGFKPDLGFFVEPNRLLTLGDNLVLWDVKKSEPVYAIELAPGLPIKSAAMAFSSNKKTLALIQRNAVQLIDAKTGALQGTIPASQSQRSICISPSGQFLAGLESSGRVWVWDLEANEIAQEFRSDARTSLEWVDDGNLLGDRKYLLDVEYRVCVWEYESDHQAELIDLGVGHFLLQTKTHLIALKLPHGDLSNKLQGLDPEDLVLIRPGDEFSLDFELPFNEAEQQEIRESLEQRMQEMGYSINAQAGMTLRGRVTKEEQQEANVRSLHFRKDLGTIKYVPHRSTIEILKDDKVIWKTSRYHSPSHFIQTKDDETLQEYADRVSKPDPSLFLSLKIPTNLSTLPGGKPLGKLNLKAARVK